MGWFKQISRSLKSMARSLKRIANALEEEEVPQDFFFHYSVGPTSLKERTHMPLTVQTTNEEKIKITVTPVTSTGQPATLDGPVSVSVIGGEATFVMIDDLSFYLISQDPPAPPGDTTFLVEADADLGQGQVLIQDTITYTVTGALAVNLGLTAGAPEPK